MVCIIIIVRMSRSKKRVTDNTRCRVLYQKHKKNKAVSISRAAVNLPSRIVQSKKVGIQRRVEKSRDKPPSSSGTKPLRVVQELVITSLPNARPHDTRLHVLDDVRVDSTLETTVVTPVLLARRT